MVMHTGDNIDGHDDSGRHGAPIQDIAALKALTEGSLFDKQLVYVEDTNTDYHYDAQSTGGGAGDETPDDQTGGTGFWIKGPAPGMSGATKEVFFPTSQGDGTKGDHQVKSVGTSGDINIEFKIPHDYTATTSIVVVAIPETTGSGKNVDLTSDYAAKGETFNIHSESDVGITYTFTNDQMDEFDISSVFSSIAAGDYCGLLWDQNATGTVKIVGIRLRYTQWQH